MIRFEDVYKFIQTCDIDKDDGSYRNDAMRNGFGSLHNSSLLVSEDRKAVAIMYRDGGGWFEPLAVIRFKEGTAEVAVKPDMNSMLKLRDGTIFPMADNVENVIDGFALEILEAATGMKSKEDKPNEEVSG